MEFIKKDEYEQIQPNTDFFNIDKMNNKVLNNFLAFTTIYRIMLIKYINKQINLEEYDNLIKNSKFNFIKIKSTDKDIYQKYNAEKLEFLYLRNNIYISNLTDDERNRFVKIIAKNGLNYNNEYELFIRETYKKVITEYYKEKIKVLINFGPSNIPFMAPNDSLVIGIRYDEYNLNNMEDNEWYINHNNQLSFIEKIKKEISEKCKKKLDINGTLIKYDEYSVYVLNDTETKIK